MYDSGKKYSPAVNCRAIEFAVFYIRKAAVNLWSESDGNIFKR